MIPPYTPKLSHEEQMARDEALYEEAQSRFRMSMLCRRTVNKGNTPLLMRIVELAAIVRSAPWKAKK